MEARRLWDNVFKVLKRKKNKIKKSPIPAQLYFKNESKLMAFQDKEKKERIVTRRPILQAILKEVFQIKRK